VRTIRTLALTPLPSEELVVAKTLKPSTGNAPKEGLKTRLKANAIFLGMALGVLWMIEIIDQISGDALQTHGIHPRDGEGLIGLVTSPLLHGDWGHLISNSIPFVVLGFFVLLRGKRAFIEVTVVTAIVGGFAVWLLAASGTNHIGASGVIFGYFGFLVGYGVFDRSLKNIALAVLVGIMYGGMIYGVLPGRSGISWEGHLFGFLAGGGLAYFIAKKAKENGGKGRVAATSKKRLL
jgi:membrane associated rhomboid family serine protease